MTQTTDPTIAYATPVARPTARTFAAVAILFGGIALVGLGGCFCVGILLVLRNGFVPGQQIPLSPSDWTFIVVLSLLALACFGGAIALMIIGTRALLRIAYS